MMRLTLDQYARMIEAGILNEKDRLVLIDGLLVEKTARSAPHVTVSRLIVKALERMMPAGWHVAKDDPIALPAGPSGHDSVPEPDVTVIRGGITDYLKRYPGPADVALVVEIADSSIQDHRTQFVRYAWAATPYASLVNLKTRQVEVYSAPSGPGPDPRYQTVQTFGEEAEIPVLLDGREVGTIRVRDILP